MGYIQFVIHITRDTTIRDSQLVTLQFVTHTFRDITIRDIIEDSFIITSYVL